MKIAIIGSTGFVGKVLLQKAINAGHQIKAPARNPESLEGLNNKIEVVKGDLSDISALRKLIGNVDAVISVAGPPMKGKFDVDAHAMLSKNIIMAMKESGVNRIITIAGAAAEIPGQALSWKQKLLRFVLANFVMPQVIAVKDMEVKFISESGLNWTIVRPPRIGKGKPSGIKVRENDLAGTKVDVEDITDFILSLLKTGEWNFKAPVVAS